MKSVSSRIKYLIGLALLIIGVQATAAAGPVTVKASLDSAYIIMGKQTALKVNVVQDKGTEGHFLNVGDTLTREIEVIRALPADTASLGSDREEITQNIIIQSFDSGLYTIKPLVYATAHDTVKSNELVLKVLPVPVDTLKTVHDYAGTATPSWKIWDLLALAFALYVVWRKRHTIINTIIPPKPPVPPYEMAMQQLNALKNQKLCEHGHEKEFYTRLTEILRVYLQRRFDINAMEMTSPQIMDVISRHEDIKPSSSIMRRILEIADFVKFANVRPMPDDNIKTFNMAVQFVEATKPEEKPEEPTADGDKKQNNIDNKDIKENK